MKKTIIILVTVFAIAFLVVSCGQELDAEKSETVIPSELSKDNDNDQGEDEGNENKPPVIDTPKIDFQIVGNWVNDAVTISSARALRISVSSDMSFILERTLDMKTWFKSSPDDYGNITVNDGIIEFIFNHGTVLSGTVIDQNKINISGFIWEREQIDFQIVGIWLTETLTLSSARYWRITVSSDMSFILERTLDLKTWFKFQDDYGIITINDDIIECIFIDGRILSGTVIDQNKIKILSWIWEKQL